MGRKLRTSVVFLSVTTNRIHLLFRFLQINNVGEYVSYPWHDCRKIWEQNLSGPSVPCPQAGMRGTAVSAIRRLLRGVDLSAEGRAREGLNVFAYSYLAIRRSPV